MIGPLLFHTTHTSIQLILPYSSHFHTTHTCPLLTINCQSKIITMKASSILALLSLGLPVLAASIPQYLEDPQNFYVSGVVKEAGTDDEFIPSRPAASNDVTFSWCSDYNQNATCSQMKLKHSWCCRCPLSALFELSSFANCGLVDDLGALDPKITKQLEGVGASNGRCMMFR